MSFCLHLIALTTEPRSPFFRLSIYLLVYPAIFFQRYLNLYVMNHSIMAYHVRLFPSSLLCFRRTKPLLFLANIALFSQFFIVYYLFSRLVLPQSTYLSILSLIPSSQHPFLPSSSFIFFFLTPFSLPSAASNEANALPVSSQCSYYSTSSCCLAPHFTSSFSSPPLCLPSFPPSHCHVLFNWRFSLIRTMYLHRNRNPYAGSILSLEGAIRPRFFILSSLIRFLISLNLNIRKGFNCHPIILPINQLSFLLTV